MTEGQDAATPREDATTRGLWSGLAAFAVLTVPAAILAGIAWLREKRTGRREWRS